MKWSKNPIVWVAFAVAVLQGLSTTVLKDNVEAVTAVNSIVLAVGAFVSRSQVYSKDTVQKELTHTLEDAEEKPEHPELEGLVDDGI